MGGVVVAVVNELKALKKSHPTTGKLYSNSLCSLLSDLKHLKMFCLILF